MVKITKYIMAALYIFMISCVIYYTFMHLSYSYNMPKSPNISSCRINPILVNHGQRVYVTNDEKVKFQTAENLFFIGGGTCFAIIAILKSLKLC